MIWQRKLGRILVVLGGLLLGTYLVPTVYGTVMSRMAVAEFRAQSQSHREWDSARIRAYQRALRVTFPPPEAVLTMPRLGLEVPVLEGVDDLTMNRGAGHVPGTAMPGHPGNIAIAGHRDGFFRVLKDVVPGDVIHLQRAGSTDSYAVRTITIVAPSDTSSLGQTAGSTLTLITCYPFRYVGSAPQRYIVRAELVSSRPGFSVPSTSGD